MYIDNASIKKLNMKLEICDIHLIKKLKLLNKTIAIAN